VLPDRDVLRPAVFLLLLSEVVYGTRPRCAPAETFRRQVDAVRPECATPVKSVSLAAGHGRSPLFLHARSTSGLVACDALQLELVSVGRGGMRCGVLIDQGVDELAASARGWRGPSVPSPLRGATSLAGPEEALR